MSPQRPLAWIVLALATCLSPEARAAGDNYYEIEWVWPPLPSYGVPSEPFFTYDAGVDTLEDSWAIVEEHRDEIDSATYERLRLSVKRAQKVTAAYERHARDFLSEYEPYESELKDLLEKIRQFHRRSDEHSGSQAVANRAEFEQFVAPFRAEYSVLRRQWDNLDARGRRFGDISENELIPEADSVNATVTRVVYELAQVIERLRKYPVIGAVGAVSGNVTATHSWEGATPVRLNSGMAVHLGDDIRTGPDGRMQVLLLDETVFTVGPKSELTLDEFVYDPNTGTGTIALTIARGLIRIVSGIIARKQPENIKVMIPFFVGGIRGTEFIIEVGDDGRSRVDVLDGRVEFTSERDGSSVQVRKGERLLIGASGTVGEVTEIDIEQVERSWTIAIGSELGAGAPPFELIHYVIGLVAVLIMLVWMFTSEGDWLESLPNWGFVILTTILAMLSIVPIDDSTTLTSIGTTGWWPWWLMACAIAGSILFYWLLLLVSVLAKELTDAMHRIWRIWIGLGVITTLAGLVLILDGGLNLFNYISRFVYPRSIFASPRIYRPVSFNDEIMMISAWTVIALGLVVLIGGWTFIGAGGWIDGALQARFNRAQRARLGHRTPPEDERDLEEAFPPPADYSDPGDDPDSEPPERKPTCPVCGGEFAGGRKSRCAQCGRLVHRASCLSRVTVEGGRLCKECSTEDVGTAREPVHAEAGTKESATECPDCGEAIRGEDRYCRSCGKSLSSWTAPAESTKKAEARHQSITMKDRTPTSGPPRLTMTELKPEQRDAKIQQAVGQLTKLGGAAVGQQRSGNVTGYNKIQEQIVAIGKRLKELGGISMVDTTYSQLERQASGSIVREITLAWGGHGGVDGWYM